MHTSLQYVKMLMWIFIAPFVLAISHSQMTNAYKFSMHTHRLNRPVKRNRLAFTGRDVGIDHNLSDDRTLLRTWPIERFSRHQSLWRWEPIAWLWASPGGQVAVAEGYRICHVFLIHPYKALVHLDNRPSPPSKRHRHLEIRRCRLTLQSHNRFPLFSVEKLLLMTEIDVDNEERRDCCQK